MDAIDPYGLECDAESAGVHIVSVPFEATTSFRRGTARGPEAIMRASCQVELFDLEFGHACEVGIAWLGDVEHTASLNEEASRLAGLIREARRNGEACDAELRHVNEIGCELNDAVNRCTRRILERKKLPVILGGDHSVSYGAWCAAAELQPGFGILQFDAHADLRAAYEGFTWSHASVMNNALREIDSLERIVQVGIRDLCDEELSAIAASEGRVRPLFDADWAKAKREHRDLCALAREHLAALPEQVWISFDIDGLDPTLCPNTGTPVPGGLDWHDAALWIKELARSGKRVVGIDLVETAPQQDRPLGEGWDESVAARLLYRLIAVASPKRP